jgi:hypothetical protein
MMFQHLLRLPQCSPGGLLGRTIVDVTMPCRSD